MTLLLAFSLLFGVALLVFASKKRSIPGAGYFILLVVSIMVYNGGYMGEINSDDFATAKFWFDFEHLAMPLNPFFWLMMALDYAQIGRRVRLIRNVLVSLPVFYYVVYFTNDFHHLYIESFRFADNGYFPVLLTQKGPLYISIVLAITAIGVACSLLFISRWMKATRLHRGSYLLMAIASLFPWITIYFNTTNTNYLGIDYAPFGMIVAGLLYMFGIFHYNIFSSIPIATETVYRHSEDAIALTDINDCIMDVNASFLRLYPELKHLTKNQKLKAFIDKHEELLALNCVGRADENPTIDFEKQYMGQTRYYSAQLTPIASESGLRIGVILSVKDISLYKEQQKQLEVLFSNAMRQAESNELSFLQAQISPHFINNTLSTISSMITRDAEAAKGLVVDLSEYLINCYRVGRSLPMARLDHELEAVTTFMRIEKVRFGERLHFSVEVEDRMQELQRQLELPMQLMLPRLVLQPLVENAVRHGVLPKREGGSVAVSIFRRGRFACFAVKDNGVGIEAERIEALLLGSDDKQGVGIINIHKRLLHYYGEGLTIKSGDGETVVSFRIPLSEGSGTT